MVPNNNTIRCLTEAALDVVMNSSDDGDARGALFDWLVGDVQVLIGLDDDKAVTFAERLVAVAHRVYSMWLAGAL